MKAKEFEEIIQPLRLLNGYECQLMRRALLGNFKKWTETKQSDTPDVKGQSEQLKAFMLFADWYKEEYNQHIPHGAMKEYIKSL